MGVPVIGCGCAVCTSADPRNKRLRTSALLEVAGMNLLIDAGPDLRQQALAVGLRRLDAVLLTHAHADHVSGLDDIRPLNFAQKSAMPLYAAASTLAFVRERFNYAFVNGSEGSTRPALELIEIRDRSPFRINSVEVLPFDVEHGTWMITGFRIGGLGYASLEFLRGLDVLVLNALRPAPHPTHFSVEQARALIDQLQPRRAFLVHMTHDLEHEATNVTFPANVRLAYDGLTVDVAEEESYVV
jgi:phosphoribosyl 1,2-cyclic phosphate phosphodiesterase